MAAILPVNFKEKEEMTMEESREEQQPKIVDAYWIDDEGNKQRELNVSNPVTLYVKVRNPVVGKIVRLNYENKDDEHFETIKISVQIEDNGVIVIKNFLTKLTNR